jgi:hypothetical protein
MASKAKYIEQARAWFHDPGVFEIAPDAQVDFEYKKGNKTTEVGAFVHCRIWLLEDDAEPE